MKTGNGGCKFCRVQPFSSVHTDYEIAETIKAYRNNQRVRHFLIGGGGDYNDATYEEIFRVLSELKKEKKPIYIMATPPQDVTILRKLKDNGVTEVGFNIEIFDRKRARELMPIKGTIELERYYKAFAEGVKVFGKGSVYCACIVGIENEKTLLQGVEKICSLGVYPTFPLYRETEGSNLNIITPSDDELESLYHKILRICKHTELKSARNVIYVKTIYLQFKLKV